MAEPSSFLHALKRILKRQQLNGQVDSSNVTLEQAIKFFRLTPEKYFVQPRTRTAYCWDADSPEFGGIITLDSADVLVRGRILAHMQNIQIVDGIATVGHLAVADQKLEGRGVGKPSPIAWRVC